MLTLGWNRQSGTQGEVEDQAHDCGRDRWCWRQPPTQAVAAGHEVTVVVRTTGRQSPDLPVRVVVDDLAAPDPVALLSRGSRGRRGAVGAGCSHRRRGRASPRGVPGPSSQAMQTAGVPRIVVVQRGLGSDPWPHPGGRTRRVPPATGSSCGIWAAPLAKAAFRRHYEDLALMEDLLGDSVLDWTLARPPRLLAQIGA